MVFGINQTGICIRDPLLSGYDSSGDLLISQSLHVSLMQATVTARASQDCCRGDRISRKKRAWYTAGA